MKHLQAFEAKTDLISGLDSLGIENLKGWYINTVNEDGYSMGYIFIARNEDELSRVINQRLSTNIQFSSGGGYTIESTARIFKKPLEALSYFFMTQQDYRFTQYFDNLKLKNASSLNASVITFPTYNPFLVGEFLNKYFYNIEEKYTTPEQRDEFEEESGN